MNEHEKPDESRHVFEFGRHRQFRSGVDAVNVTKGGLFWHRADEADPHQVWVPGERWYAIDGVRVTEEAFKAALKEDGYIA